MFLCFRHQSDPKAPPRDAPQSLLDWSTAPLARHRLRHQALWCISWRRLWITLMPKTQKHSRFGRSACQRGRREGGKRGEGGALSVGWGGESRQEPTRAEELTHHPLDQRPSHRCSSCHTQARAHMSRTCVPKHATQRRVGHGIMRRGGCVPLEQANFLHSSSSQCGCALPAQSIYTNPLPPNPSPPP
jgi:hypothetical protein